MDYILFVVLIILPFIIIIKYQYHMYFILIPITRKNTPRRYIYPYFQLLPLE